MDPRRAALGLLALAALAALALLALARFAGSEPMPRAISVADAAVRVDRVDPPIEPNSGAPSASVPVSAERAPALPAHRFLRFLRVRVAYADGTPAPLARLVLHDARAALDEARTDDSGRATLRCAPAALERELWIAVAGAGFGVHDEPLPEDAELAPEIAIALPHVGRVAGRVTVDGIAPATALELALHDFEERPATLPELLWIDLRGERVESARPCQTALTSTPDGTFVFRGVPEVGDARLHAPAGHWFSTERGATPSLAVSGAAEALAIQLVPFEALRGRVVSPAGVAAARASVSCEFYTDGVRVELATESDELGGFEFRMPPSWEELRVEARSIDRREVAVSRYRSSLALSAFGDVGEFLLEPAVSRDVRVRDRDGRPIEGAQVVYGRELARTGRDGVARILVRVEERFSVSAAGFRTASARASEEQTVDVELVPETELVVIVRAPDGACLGGIGFGVALVPGAPLFHPAWNPYGGHPTPTGVRIERESDRLDRYGFAIDASCELRIVGFSEGVPLVLRLVDPTGFVVAATSVPATSSSMRVELVAEQPSRPLFGRVLEATGEPARGALVTALHAADGVNERWSARLRTDRQGRFRVETCAPALRLEVEFKTGERLRLPFVDPDDSPLELRMVKR